MTVFAAGWTQQTNGQWCYLENDGSKATDVWRKSGDNWFYLDSYGNMAVNQLIDDTDYVNEAGARLPMHGKSFRMTTGTAAAQYGITLQTAARQ